MGEIVEAGANPAPPTDYLPCVAVTERTEYYALVLWGHTTKT